MSVSYQLVIDCTSPEPLALFWAEAQHYVIAPPPSGFDSWDDFFRSIGVPEDELGGGSDIIEDPNGEVRTSGSRASRRDVPAGLPRLPMTRRKRCWIAESGELLLRSGSVRQGRRRRLCRCRGGGRSCSRDVP